MVKITPLNTQFSDAIQIDNELGIFGVVRFVIAVWRVYGFGVRVKDTGYDNSFIIERADGTELMLCEAFN